MHKAALPLFTRAIEVMAAAFGPHQPTTESIRINLVMSQNNLRTANTIDGTGLPQANKKRNENGHVVAVDAVVTGTYLSRFSLDHLHSLANVTSQV